MKRILITGANGQLGSELQSLSTRESGFLFLFTDYDTLDITDNQAVEHFFAEELPDFVINCAAYTAVDKAELEEEAAIRLNSVAPGILSMESKAISAKLIHISTDYVFDGTKNRPYNEDDPVKPLGVYGRTKQEGEINILANPDAMVIRTSWLYSSFGNNFVKTMVRLGKERQSLNVVFDQAGTPTYARDLAGAILEIIRNSAQDADFWKPGIYHYSNEGVCSWYDFALAIHHFAGISCQIHPVESMDFPTLTQRPHYSVLNKSKIKSTFGITIPYWMDSLKNCIQQLNTA
jgi:dTDP-4-dehydrorhamnose reductase